MRTVDDWRREAAIARLQSSIEKILQDRDNETDRRTLEYEVEEDWQKYCNKDMSTVVDKVTHKIRFRNRYAANQKLRRWFGGC